MSSTAPPKRTPRKQDMVCPSCKGENFTARASFKTASEPVLGAVSTSVVVDLMSCEHCGADLPAVRGRRRYALVGEERLSALVAELEEARRANSEMQKLLGVMERRSKSIGADIERCRAEGELSVIEARVAAMERVNDGLEERRARLARTLELTASRIPVAR